MIVIRLPELSPPTQATAETLRQKMLYHIFCPFFSFFSIIIIKQIYIFFLSLFNADRHSYEIAYIFSIFVVVANRYGVDIWTFEI